MKHVYIPSLMYIFHTKQQHCHGAVIISTPQGKQPQTRTVAGSESIGIQILGMQIYTPINKYLSKSELNRIKLKIKVLLSVAYLLLSLLKAYLLMRSCPFIAYVSSKKFSITVQKNKTKTKTQNQNISTKLLGDIKHRMAEIIHMTHIIH